MSTTLASRSPAPPTPAMRMDLHASVRKSSVWMVAKLVISLTVGASVTTFIIRSLSVEDYGIYTVLYSLIGYVGVIGSFGIPEVFRRFLPELLQKEDYSLLRRLVWRGLILRVLLSALTVAVILLLHGPIGRLLKLESFLNYFSIFAFGIVFSLEASLLTSVLHSLFLHKYSVIASTLHTLFRGGCVFVLLEMDWGIRGVLWAEVASWGLWTLLQFFLYHRKFLRHHPAPGEHTPFPLRRFFRYGGLSSLNELGSTVLGVSTDFFVITAFLGPGAVALYAFADRVVKMLLHCMPHIVLIDVIRPTFFTKYAQTGSKQHLADMFNLLVKMGAFCVFPLAVGTFVLGDKVIAIVFKSDYLPAKIIVWVLIFSAALNVFAEPTGLVLQAVEQVQINLYSKAFAIYNIVVEIIIVQHYGVMAVVFVTCSAVLMKNLFCFYFARRYASISVDWRGLLVIIANAGCMGIVLWLLRSLVNGPVSLAFVATTGAVAYLLFSWANKAFSLQERGWVNRTIPKPLFTF